MKYLASTFFKFSLAAAFAALTLHSDPAQAEHVNSDKSDLGSMSIEQLINLEVTTVSKKLQKLKTSAAAIFVLTQEDIRRSGATSIPQLLRLVPGLNVAGISSNMWGISSRGFNAIFANKLLVLVDGRTVYTPLYSGVFWDEVDTYLPDIERIEVIRGPGATLWGSNAVNGVINIITKDARESVGESAQVGGGSDEQFFAGARTGAKVGDDSAVRVYAKYFNRDNFKNTAGAPAQDAWSQARAGFRMDSAPTSDNTITLQSDTYYGQDDLSITVPTLFPPFSENQIGQRYISGTNLLGRVSHTVSATSDLQVQMYYDRIERDDIILDQQRDLFDIDAQHRFQLLEGHDLMYGAGFRFYRDNLGNTSTVTFEPDSRNVDHLSWFIQDDMAFLNDDLHLILGSKFENSEFTGFEFQPNARATLNVGEASSVWGAVSRAVRTPSRAHEDISLALQAFPGDPLPGLASVMGDGTVDSENLTAYEIGFRSELRENLSIDVATFYNSYSDLVTVEPDMPKLVLTPPPHALVPFVFDNGMSGYTYGAELVADWRPANWWRLVGSYTYLGIDLSHDPGSADTISILAEDESPNNQFMIRSLIDLPHNLELDSNLRYVDNIPAYGIESYFELDLRVAWKATSKLELAVVGQNLLQDSHREYQANFVNLESVELERGVYAVLTWKD